MGNGCYGGDEPQHQIFGLVRWWSGGAVIPGVMIRVSSIIVFTVSSSGGTNTTRSGEVRSECCGQSVILRLPATVFMINNYWA